MKRILLLLTAILSPAQKRRFVLVQIFLVFFGAVQVAGVASIAPFIALLSYPQLIHTNALAQKIFTTLGFATDKSFLIAFAFGLMTLIVLSNIVAAFAAWFILSFSLRLGVEIQLDIYRGYMHRDYVEFSRINSASLISVITQDANRFVYMIVMPFLNLVSQAVMVILIVGGLLWYRPFIAITAAGIIGGGYLLMFLVARELLAKHGGIVWAVQAVKHRLLAESLGGIKEIKLVGTEELYQQRISETSRSAHHSDKVILLIGELPRFVLESIAFCALLGLGALLLSRAQHPGDIVGVLSLYAMTGYKLLPAAQNIYKSAAHMRSNVAAAEELLPDIRAGRAVPEVDPNQPPTVPMPLGDIEMRNITYVYPGTEEPVVRNMSFTIKRNSITALVGASGAGKSTLADLLLGLLNPTSGQILVGGKNIADSIPNWQRNLGYVPQNIFILDDTIAVNMSFGSASDIDMAKVRRAARMANIDEFIETLPEQYDFVVGERGAILSGGQRQRIGIARALYHDAEVLILDEATSALDSITERDIITTINDLKQHKTIVMIAHRLSTIKGADQILLLQGGQLLQAGSFNEVYENSSEFRELVAAGFDESPV